MRAAFLLLPLLGIGCAPLITPVGVALTAGATGGTMAMQERGLDGGVSDNALALAINDAWLREDPAIFRKVSTSIHDGVVVLTGHVTYRETAQRAETVTRGVAGVREVVNHIRVDREPGLGTMASDRWITTRLRAELTFDTEINAVNYAIDTVAGTVFLSGIARDQAEIDRVVARAKRTSGVRDVVTAVRLRSEPLPPYATAVAAPPPVPVAAPSPSPAPPRAGMAVTAEPLPPPRAVTAAR
ncbi:MAG: BON domain-containing protein [Acetobacteraceae bacterium]|jgi:osmotically-inducible protein OsmY|nr:BON domain-containing protein [Acetobacteraceae bacterium]